MDRDIVTPSDLFELSQTTFSLGTARSMAMAGAFTSLGADLTSMAINRRAWACTGTTKFRSRL